MTGWISSISEILLGYLEQFHSRITPMTVGAEKWQVLSKKEGGLKYVVWPNTLDTIDKNHRVSAQIKLAVSLVH